MGLKFADWLQEQLDEHGYGLNEFARICGASSAAISYVLSTSRNPGPDLCLKISHGLGIPAEEVFRKAGLLPQLEPGTEADPTIQAVLDRLKYLSPEERREALSLVDVVYRRKHRGA